MTDRFKADLAAIAEIQAIPVLLDIIARSTGMGVVVVACATETRLVAGAIRDGIGLGLIPGAELPIEPNIGNLIRESSQTVIIENLALDPQFRDLPAGRDPFQSYISAPIRFEDGVMFGALCAFDKVARPLAQPETIAMFETFAGQIGFHLNALNRVTAAEASLSDARRSSALSDQFIAVLGHDLRNPLTAVLGGMEMLRRNPLNERALQWAEIVVASASRMAQMIDVVMDFSRGRLGSGLLVECLECGSVEPSLTDAVSEFRSSKPGREIQSHFAMTEPVFCDLRRIKQLAVNLLGNAIAYGDPAQPVRIEAKTLDGWFEVFVANEGEPIPEALLTTIFEPFSRGSVQPSREGLGLGLYISHQIALAHGGTLKVASTPVETRFTFRMQVAPAVPS